MVVYSNKHTASSLLQVKCIISSTTGISVILEMKLWVLFSRYLAGPQRHPDMTKQMRKIWPLGYYNWQSKEIEKRN